MICPQEIEPEPIALCAGDRLAAKYLLIEPLAAGGMGQVWTARNLTTGARVAAKVLLPKQASAAGLARFRREARATASLSHRAIVRVFDLVELDPARGSLVMIMELLRGETLCDRLEQKGALGVEETLQIAFPLLSALAHAHGLGVVHRDLKPDNVFLALEPDGERMPKLVDFGISKLIREHPITLAGQIVGTQNYMSPEQTTGAEIDERSDVFSLGVLLYECLSGHNPFVRPHAGAAGVLDLTSVLQIEPRPLDHLPPALWSVLRRAIAKNVDERFQSASDFSRALSEAVPSCCASRDVRSSTIPPVTATDLPDVRRPPRLARAIGAGVVLAVLCALGLASSPSSAKSVSRRGHRAEGVSAVTHAKGIVATFDRIGASPSPDGASPSSRSPVRVPPRAFHAVLRRGGVLRDPGF